MSHPEPDTRTIERLQELLDLKDEQLQRASVQIEDLQRQLRYGIGPEWMLHSRIDNDDLPTPRIEMLLIDNSDFQCEASASLILRERCGRTSRIPLDYSKRSGGGISIDVFPLSGDVPDALLRNGSLPGVFHDALFHSKATGMPAYVVLDEAHRYHVTSLVPLKMRAVELPARAPN